MSPARRPRIFVQIAAYRDPECQFTVRDLFSKARHPERVRVAICWQYQPGVDPDAVPVEAHYRTQVKIDSVPCHESLGVSWARRRIQLHFDGEAYTLAIDSHMRFVDGWDEALLDELARCPAERPLLSNHPASYEPPDRRDLAARPNILCAQPFSDNGNLRITGRVLDRVPDRPLNGAFIAAGFIFGGGEMVTEIPYDPYFYFNQEEIALSARLWTHGWDPFSPARILIYHYYMTARSRLGRPLHWEDNAAWTKLSQLGRERYLHLFGMQPASNPEALRDLELYGFGTRRSLADYEAYTGIDFGKRSVSERACKGLFVDGLERWLIAERNAGSNHRPPQPIAPPAPAPGAQRIDLAASQVRDVARGLYMPNRVFESQVGIHRDAGQRPRRPAVVRRGLPPELLVIENYLSPEACALLCRYADRSIGRNLQVVDAERSTAEKVSTKASAGRVTEHVGIDGMAADILYLFMDLYTRRMAPFYGGVRFEWLERPQILRYRAGGKYDPHADAEHIDQASRAWVRAQDRDYSVLLYLNDAYRGGDLNLVKFGYRIKPGTGMVVAFPSDHRYLHAAEPLLEGTRYVMVSWGAVQGTPRVNRRPPYAAVLLNLPGTAG
jgi:hypothetical protein